MAMIELITLTLPTFPQFLETLKKFGFLNIVASFLNNGSLGEKMNAGKFFALLTDAVFFRFEKNEFIERGIVDLLIDLVVAAGSTQEMLVLITGLLNVVCYLKRTRSQDDLPLLKSFYSPDLINFLVDIDLIEEDSVHDCLSIMVTSLQEIDPTYLNPARSFP
jgi:hypothetical protein